MLEVFGKLRGVEVGLEVTRVKSAAGAELTVRVELTWLLGCWLWLVELTRWSTVGWELSVTAEEVDTVEELVEMVGVLVWTGLFNFSPISSIFSSRFPSLELNSLA